MSEGKEVPEEVKMLLALTPQELRVIFAVRREQALKTLPPNSLDNQQKSSILHSKAQIAMFLFASTLPLVSVLIFIDT